MLKKSLMVASLLLAGTSSVAKDTSKYYIGIGINSGSGIQTRSYSSGGEYETEYDASSTNIKFGFLRSDGNRWEINVDTIAADKTGGSTFNANTTSNDTSSEYSGYNLDYLIMFNGEEKLKPYIDLGFGIYNNDEITGYNSSTGTAETATGFALNIGAGLVYAVTNNIEIEGTYKMKSISWNLENPDTSEKINMMYIGTNIKF